MLPQRKTGRLLSPDDLRELGSRASKMHLCSDMPLSDAVLKVAEEYGGLGPEHVRRVVEFANNATFQSMFKQAGGDHRVISFRGGPADPSYVLKEMNMSMDAQTEDFRPGMDSGVDDPFDQVKVAAYDSTESLRGMVKAATREWMDLKRLEVHFADCYRDASGDYEEARDRLCKEARCLLADGGTVTDISRAITQVSRVEGMSKLALKHIERDFVGRGIRMEKRATLSREAALVRVRHPLVQAFLGFEKAAFDRFRYAAALEKVEEEKSQAARRLREVYDESA